ncbi:hypothetical protein TSH100_05015 [Azospirillum sp. TSH100]|uniref:DUF4126 domain-containing protein n=1 Tax=Azospirillum sp. TSH100 TaxID=652764 RepID=UPI000D62039C|nr:DUF4126 domain-containing protein [Azospirillum sp. TSH100]PWC89405.1 hypothetical protein TSH100_05015 [Azospirillum sp. TSH100]QCG90239.1 DUF4126 domain-containing protein [Azospirillum sp. TSH100]
MLALLLAGLIGVVAGSRTLIAPAAVSWGACGGWLDVSGSWLFFLGQPVSPWVFTAMAVVELIVDKLPTTPSRKLPFAFASRIAGGAIAGAAISANTGFWIGGLVAGGIGAVAGTLVGYAARMRMTAAFGRDRPAAVIEDAVALAAAVLIIGMA